MKKTLIHANPIPSSRTLTQKDRLLLLALMAVYAIVAFVNLGTTAFPTHPWIGETEETVIIDLGTECDVSQIWLNGNIAEGTIRFYDDSDHYTEVKQDFGDMFKWKQCNVPLHTRYVRLFVASGNAAFNEIAIFDANGNRIDASIYVQYDARGVDQFPNQQALLDEQNTVPSEPSYLNGMYFDEIYHARTAYEIVTDTNLYFEGKRVGVTDFSYVRDNGFSIYEWTHPQLGKVLIALGVRIFGMNPFGWRFTGTLFGVLILWVLYALAKRIFRRTEYAFLTAGLFAVDCMHFSQTRIATIDVYALFFTLLMFLFMLDYMEQNRTDAPFEKQMLSLGLCGLAFGLGASSKWTCLYSGAGLAVLFFTQFIARCVSWFRDRKESKKHGMQVGKIVINPIPLLPVLYTLGAFVLFAAAKLSHPSQGFFYRVKYDWEWYDLILANGFWIPMLFLSVAAIVSAFLFRRFTKGKDFDLRWNRQCMTLVLCCVFFILIPVILYYASSYSFYLSENRNTLHEQLQCLWDKQKSMYAYHAGLDATHPCQSNWYEWFFAEKSVWFYAGYPDGKLSNISSTGNPAVWYVSAILALLMLIRIVFHKDDRKNRSYWVVIVGILSGILPWVFVSRCVFLYHYFSALPFVMLAGIAFLYEAEKQYPQVRTIRWIWLGVSAAFFLLMYPAISGLPMEFGYAGFIEHVLTIFGKVFYVSV
ncbi:MAG: glycosyltransferase family 39 protein [Clostridia bacterium]|nr:glycosyltransferase family 39 protein [Clostridia bacterium]